MTKPYACAFDDPPSTAWIPRRGDRVWINHATHFVDGLSGHVLSFSLPWIRVLAKRRAIHYRLALTIDDVRPHPQPATIDAAELDRLEQSSRHFSEASPTERIEEEEETCFQFVLFS